MVLAKLLLSNHHGSQVERLGFSITARHLVENCQIVKAKGSIEMARTKLLLSNCQGAQEEGFGLSIAP